MRFVAWLERITGPPCVASHWAVRSWSFQPNPRRQHWERTGIMTIDLAETMPEGWQRWLDWQRAVAPDNDVEIRALEADRGSYLGYVSLVGRRNGRTPLADHIVSVPAQTYTKKPLLQGADY